MFFQSTQMRLILSWGDKPNDLDAHVNFYDKDGNGKCSVYYKDTHRKCGNYAELDVDHKDYVSIFSISFYQSFYLDDFIIIFSG